MSRNTIIENIITSFKNNSKKESIWYFEIDGERLVMNSRKSSWRTKGQAMSALIASIKSRLYVNNEEWFVSPSQVKPAILTMIKAGTLKLKEAR